MGVGYQGMMETVLNQRTMAFRKDNTYSIPDKSSGFQTKQKQNKTEILTFYLKAPNCSTIPSYLLI